MSERLFVRQLLAGRDFAVGDPVAASMRNFVYVVGDQVRREVVLVDPAYAPGELVEVMRADDWEVVGAVATHYHADHVGGSLFGQTPIAGIRELLELLDVPVHVQRDEARWVRERTGVGDDHLVAHDDGDEVLVGDVSLRLVHTPGHTPGSQCVLVGDCLLTGDTLFLDGCGRTDLPGGDPEEMYRTLHDRLAPLSGRAVVYPGHLYSPEPQARLEDVRRTNAVLAPRTREEWLSVFG